jgi:hypothetical protein
VPLLNPFKLLVYAPVPAPVVVLNVEAPEVVPQTIPLAITDVPPSAVIVPPLDAVVPVTDVTDAVAETVAVVNVVKFISVP